MCKLLLLFFLANDQILSLEEMKNNIGYYIHKYVKRLHDLTEVMQSVNVTSIRPTVCSITYSLLSGIIVSQVIHAEMIFSRLFDNIIVPRRDVGNITELSACLR